MKFAQVTDKFLAAEKPITVLIQTVKAVGNFHLYPQAIIQSRALLAHAWPFQALVISLDLLVVFPSKS